jgi:2-amino-4-hydroxy-6-hydroxymethyldihydropteridine diphosphokinase
MRGAVRCASAGRLPAYRVPAKYRLKIGQLRHGPQTGAPPTPWTGTRYDMSNTAYIALGTNLGDRAANYKKAVDTIAELEGTRITRRSSLYESEPHGRARNWFLNGVIEIQTELDPNELLKALQKIETGMGRKRPAKGEGGKKSGTSVSRVIDLDILLYGRLTVEERRLKIPHLELANRKFVLLPLSELVPAFVHPVLGVTISELLVGCKDEKKTHLFRQPLAREMMR